MWGLLAEGYFGPAADRFQQRFIFLGFPQSRNRLMKDMKLTIVLAAAFALSSTFALASKVRHKPSVRTHALHRVIPQIGSVNPNYGNPAGTTGVSAGGYLWNGRSASEWGGG
jgi:hypothetical protein